MYYIVLIQFIKNQNCMQFLNSTDCIDIDQNN